MGFVLTWPVGHATHSRRGSPPAPALPVVAYTLAAALGGGVAGYGLAQAGTLASETSYTVDAALVATASAIALTAIVLQWYGRVDPLPERQAQVPRQWLLWRRPPFTAAAFGVMIGSGVLTRLMHATAYVLAAMVVVAPSVEAGALIGVVYGMSRGMTLVLTWAGDRLVGRRLRWPGPGPSSQRLNGTLAIAALAAFAAAILVVQ